MLSCMWGVIFLTLDIFHHLELVRLKIYSHNMTGHAGEPTKTLLLCKIYIILGIAPAVGCPVVKRCILYEENILVRLQLFTEKPNPKQTVNTTNNSDISFSLH